MSPDAIILNGQLFSTATAAKYFFREILYKYEIGQMVDDVEDKKFLTCLLARHPYVKDWKKKPIVGFRIAKAELYGRGNRRFELVREDGSANDFSYLKCISSPSNPHFQDVVLAMRCEVLEQTRKFHNDAFSESPNVCCGITGEPVKRHTSQVDHAAPLTFSVLISDFFKTSGVQLEDIIISREGRHGLIGAKYLADRCLALRWQEYHQIHAQLRITSKAANLRQRKIKGDF